jgi:hypothetical protein
VKERVVKARSTSPLAANILAVLHAIAPRIGTASERFIAAELARRAVRCTPAKLNGTLEAMVIAKRLRRRPVNDVWFYDLPPREKNAPLQGFDAAPAIDCAVRCIGIHVEGGIEEIAAALAAFVKRVTGDA